MIAAWGINAASVAQFAGESLDACRAVADDDEFQPRTTGQVYRRGLHNGVEKQLSPLKKNLRNRILAWVILCVVLCGTFVANRPLFAQTASDGSFKVGDSDTISVEGAEVISTRRARNKSCSSIACDANKPRDHSAVPVGPRAASGAPKVVFAGGYQPRAQEAPAFSVPTNGQFASRAIETFFDPYRQDFDLASKYLRDLYDTSTNLATASLTRALTSDESNSSHLVLDTPYVQLGPVVTSVPKRIGDSSFWSHDIITSLQAHVTLLEDDVNADISRETTAGFNTLGISASRLSFHDLKFAIDYHYKFFTAVSHVSNLSLSVTHPRGDAYLNLTVGPLSYDEGDPRLVAHSKIGAAGFNAHVSANTTLQLHGSWSRFTQTDSGGWSDYSTGIELKYLF
jgi:hypothetical protein